MTEKEKELLKRAATGDSAAYGEIISKYRYLVYALALQVTRDHVAAQDIAQDVFVTAYVALKELRSAEAFPSWLRTITRNRAIAWRRQQRRFVAIEDVEKLRHAPVPAPESTTERRERDVFGSRVRRILFSLSDARRIPVLLCYLEGTSTAEAARFLGLKESTLRKRLHDAKKELQRRIVGMAEKTLQEFRLPRGFAKRCVCGCRRARQERSNTERR
ncbi:MAG: RNA polymerase sigma factor [Acidobacteriota bacterium]